MLPGNVLDSEFVKAWTGLGPEQKKVCLPSNIVILFSTNLNFVSQVFQDQSKQLKVRFPH